MSNLARLVCFSTFLSLLAFTVFGQEVLPQSEPPFKGTIGNACIPGPYKVGQVDYNFEDEFDLIPSGTTVPAYPDVDVRATVRYPATNTGVQQPIAGFRRYPLVLFLHGNHATCPCSCSHAARQRAASLTTWATTTCSTCWLAGVSWRYRSMASMSPAQAASQ